MGKKDLIPDYQAMAEFRYQMRRFLRFSEEAARGAGLEPQQHQLLLSLKGLRADRSATVGVLAERLQIQHHSAGELVDRLVAKGLVGRYRGRVDRRQVYLRLTRRGDEVLRKLALHHLEELQSAGPAMVRMLSSLMRDAAAPLTRRSDRSVTDGIPTARALRKMTSK